MSFLFKSQSTPSITTPPAPTYDAKSTTEDEKKRLTQGRKKRPTLVTGPRGILEPAPVEKKVLLGE